MDWKFNTRTERAVAVSIVAVLVSYALFAAAVLAWGVN